MHRLDRFIYLNYYRLPLCLYWMVDKYQLNIPSKRLVKYCLGNTTNWTNRLYDIAYWWAYEADDLEELATIQGIPNTERARQLLAKFVRQNYRR